jgi:hypothetical protein
MAFSTVGVGYGLVLRVSARHDFRFPEVRRSSWIISVLAMMFCLLCSIVVYTELSLIGSVMEAEAFIHILSEGPS